MEIPNATKTKLNEATREQITRCLHRAYRENGINEHEQRMRADSKLIV